MPKVVYIDPMSASNLALYDYNLLSRLDADIVYCCSIHYDNQVIPSIRYEHIFRYNHKRNPITKFLSYGMSMIKLITIIKETRPDVVHVQWWKSWLIDYPALLLYKRYASKVVYTAHNVLPHNTKGRAIEIKCRKYYRHVDKIIVHAEKTKIELMDQFGIKERKIAVVPHGILEFKFNKATIDEMEEKLAQRYKLDGKLVFSALGRQSYYKGTDIIIRAWLSSKQLCNSDDVVLLIVGKGNVAKELVPSTVRNIIYEDSFVTPEEFEAYLRLSDVLLLPYRKISQSGVMLTAISRHIPFVVTDVGGLAEPLTVEKVGWSIKRPDVHELQYMMEFLYRHPSEIDAVKKDKKAWGCVSAIYGWDNAAKLTMECYNE